MKSIMETLKKHHENFLKTSLCFLIKTMMFFLTNKTLFVNGLKIQFNTISSV